jgi:hypothetical protein
VSAWVRSGGSRGRSKQRHGRALSTNLVAVQVLCSKVSFTSVCRNTALWRQQEAIGEGGRSAWSRPSREDAGTEGEKVRGSSSAVSVLCDYGELKRQGCQKRPSAGWQMEGVRTRNCVTDQSLHRQFNPWLRRVGRRLIIHAERRAQSNRQARTGRIAGRNAWIATILHGSTRRRACPRIL